MRACTREESLAVAAVTMAARREMLTLRLGGGEYGIDIPSVQEIRSWEQPIRMAGAPPHALGVSNLRGVIVPIVDLRCRFGLDAAFDSITVTLMLGVGGRTVGAVVDAVSDVVALAPEHIEPAPAFNGASEASDITGIGTPGADERARMLMLLDIELLMSSVQMGSSVTPSC
jgi:purine-binding chemotaxis protein CheW